MNVEEKLEQISTQLEENKKLTQNLQGTVDQISETINSDVADLTVVKTQTAIIETRVKTVSEQIPAQTREIRQTVERNIKYRMQIVEDVHKILLHIMKSNPRFIYYEIKETIWDRFFRNKKVIRPVRTERG